MINATMNSKNIELTGKISPRIKLVGKIVPNAVKLVGRVAIPVGYEHYEGVYEVTPKIDPYTLGTKDKVMYSDLTVKAIPYYEVSNEHGGTTIIIGGE